MDNQGNVGDAEADFVIAHPQMGVLVLEVKGGGVARDMRKGIWTTTDRKGDTFDIKDPGKQARTNKYKLLTVLRKSIRHFIVMGHAVAFPDILTQAQRLGPDLSPEIVLDLSHLSTLAAWVKRAMKYWWQDTLPERRIALGEDGIRALLTILGKQWAFRPALWGAMTDEHRELASLTQQQYMILDVLNNHRHALISGFAGSGKTMLALEKAVRLARQGFRVLLLCYNKSLAYDLRTRVSWGIDLYIYNFHKFCMKVAQETGMEDIVMDVRTDEYFRTVLPQVLRGSTARRRVVYPASLPRTFQAIIVDEGQDFYEEWWSALQELFPQEQDTIFYIFYDDHQRLYPTPLAYPIASEPYPLAVNCRTTQAIHRHFMRFYPGTDTHTARGPEGRPPVLIEYATGDLQQTLEATLLALTKEQGIPLKEIMVLTPFSRQKSALQPIKELINWYQEKDQAVFSTIHAAKGLERPVILLAELERRFPTEKQRQNMEQYLYIACSRAQSHLILLLSKPLSRFHRDLFGL